MAKLNKSHSRRLLFYYMAYNFLIVNVITFLLNWTDGYSGIEYTRTIIRTSITTNVAVTIISFVFYLIIREGLYLIS